ncbi:MAG: hypothetical protein IH841_07685 [Thaumarchaeota archaeon]|nr:hypothetical protein [Nitrososphaerota archaeon]
MGDLAGCGLVDLSIMVFVIGGVIASISFSMYKNNKIAVTKEIQQFSS